MIKGVLRMDNNTNMINKTSQLNKEHYNSKLQKSLNYYKNNPKTLKNIKLEMSYSKVIRLFYHYSKKLIIGSSTHILDMGCGTGALAVLMASHKAIVTAIDISEVNIEITKLRAKRNSIENIYSIVGSCDDTGLNDESFDIIYGMGIIHHLSVDIEEKTYAEVYRLLKPGGTAIFCESVINSAALDYIRKIIPIYQKHNPRPSILQKSYADFAKNDPHPIRPNNTNHYRKMLSQQNWKEVSLQGIGIFSRLDRLTTNFRIRKFIHDIDYFIQPIIPFQGRWVRNLIIILKK